MTAAAVMQCIRELQRQAPQGGKGAGGLVIWLTLPGIIARIVTVGCLPFALAARIVVLGLLPLQPPHMRRLPFGAAVAVANKEVQDAVQRQASDKLVFKGWGTSGLAARRHVCFVPLEPYDCVRCKWCPHAACLPASRCMQIAAHPLLMQAGRSGWI